MPAVLHMWRRMWWRKRSLQGVGTHQVTAVLLGGEVVKAIAVAAHEVREDGAGHHGRLSLQTGYQARHVVERVEAHAVHAGVQFYVYGHVRDARVLGCSDEGIEQTEAVDLGLEVILKHGIEARHLGIHHHDVFRYAVGPEQSTLVGHRHGQVGHLLLALQRLGHFHGSGPIGVGLHHTDDAGGGTEERTVVVEVLHHGPQVDLQYGLVYASAPWPR